MRYMKIGIVALFMACVIVVSACSGGQGEDTQTTEADEVLSNFALYSFDDITINAPENWTISKETAPGGYRAEFRDYDVEAIRWYSVDVYTHLSVFVTNEEWALQYPTSQEYIDKQYEDITPDAEKEKTMLVIDGVEAGKITHKRPYFDYKFTEVFIPYNGKEYIIGIHYDSADEELTEIANEIINSIKLTPS